MGRLWKFKWPVSWFVSPRLSTSSTKNTGIIDLVLGTESGSFQSKPSYAYLEGKKDFKEKAFFSTVSPFGRWIKVGTGFLLILLFLCIINLRFGWKRNFSTPELSHFSVIFDCGSTGTRIHVYEWSHKGKAQGNLPMLVHSRSGEPGENSGQLNGYPMMQTEPGLDKYLHNETGLRGSIEPLLHWAEQVVPPYAHRKTHVFLLATAGLRRLPVSDVKWILDKLWTILLTSPFRCQRSRTRVISGVEEAYYGWVALNYEMNKLQNAPHQTTFGAIDLGGSSLEVTFESEKENRGEYAMKLNIGLTERQLYAYSIPGYGLNDAFEKSVILLYKRFLEKNSTELYSANHQLQLRHPCLHVGYRQSFYCSKCYPLHPHGSPQNGRSSTGNEFIAPQIELVGDPNWVECQTLAKSTVNASLWSDSAIAMNCDDYPCALDKHQPQPRGRFFLLSGFFFVYRFFNLTSTATYEEILEKGQQYCLKTWHDASRSAIRHPFIEQHCFRAPYIVALLRDGLHLRDTQIIIGSGNLTWTLGAALLEAANLFPRNEALEGRHQPMPDKLTIGYFKLDKDTCIILMLILITLGLFVVMLRKV